MRLRHALTLGALAASALMPSRAAAQGGRVIDLTVDMLNRFFTGYDKQQTAQADVSTQLADVDAKIQKWKDCAQGFMAVGANDPSKLGFAAKMAMKAKCGSTSDNDLQKQRAQILSGPENAAAQAAGFKLADYQNLRDHIQSYAGGDRSGFTAGGLDVLKGRASDITSRFGAAQVAQSGGSGRGSSGGSMPASMGMGGVWTTDYAWAFIGQLFAVQYMSGAQMFERDYKPGDWTQWSVSVEDNDAAENTERAFIARQPDGGEWWRIKTITANSERTDTVTLEALFKPQPGNQYVQQLVRMRAKLPGSTSAQEMMVPQQWAMVSMAGALGMRPTQESLDGATLGVETVATPAGSFRAKHVQFGIGSGSLNWWLDSTATGGWVKFAMMQDNKAKYTMQLIGKGTGAKSELGVAGAATPGGGTTALVAPAAPVPSAQDAPDVSRDDEITADKLDRFIKGLNAMNTQFVKDSTARHVADEDAYQRIAINASGIDHDTFARIAERLRGYIANPSGNLAGQFTAAEIPLLKKKDAAIKSAMVHIDHAW
jgi:hypothetical protein